MCTKVTTTNDLDVSTGTGNNAIAGNNVTAGNVVITHTNVTTVAKQNDSW
jgi:hypothetical protein